MDYYIRPDGELYHWGIKGQKWGVRKYQNKDGSLTPAGRKRYNSEVEALKNREKTIKNRERNAARMAKLDAKKADLDAREASLNAGDKKKRPLDNLFKKKTDAPDANLSKGNQRKKLEDMTDAELTEAINRARMEDTYRNLRPDPVAKPGFAKRMVDSMAPALIESGKSAVKNIVDAKVKDMLKDKVAPGSLEAILKENAKLEALNLNKYLKDGYLFGVKGDTVKEWNSFIKERDAAKKAEEEAAAAAKKAKQEARNEKWNATKEAAKEFGKGAKEAWNDRKAEKERIRKEAEERRDRENDSKTPDAEYEQLRKEGKTTPYADYQRWKDETIRRNEQQKKAKAEAENNRRREKEYNELYAELYRDKGNDLNLTDRLSANLGHIGTFDDLDRSSAARRGREAFAKLNDKIDWDEYLWDDDI